MQTEENRISTGIDGLDDVLGGGLPEGHLYLLEGSRHRENDSWVTVMVLAQAGLLGTMRSPVDLSYLADNVLLLRYFEAAGKSTQGGFSPEKTQREHEDSIRELRLSPGRIEVGDPLRDFHGILTGLPIFTGGANGQRLAAGVEPADGPQ